VAQSESSYAAQLLKQKGFSADKLRLQIKVLPEEKVQEPKRNSKEASAEERKFLETIRRVGELVSRGEGRSALQSLDDFMAEPGQDRQLRMSLLHFAAVTAMQIGDLKTAQRYCEERLSYTPQDPMALYALADCLAWQGETNDAARRAADCRRAALSQGEHGKGIVELVEKRFPELKGEP
jgi:Flp pilus assembly protein TadD